MTKILTGPKMTIREEQFVTAYLADPKRSQKNAAIAAGYSARSSEKQGWEIIRRPRVKAAITKALKDQQARTLITADKVLLDINALADRAAKAGEFHAAIRGKELIGKHYKLFTETHEHGGIGGGPVQFLITEKEADL
jgi:hypothetical protein